MDDDLNILRVDNKQLSYKTKRALLELICSSTHDGTPFKLPNEDDLSHRLGVSRNVLRDALASLEEMGVVTRRRGKGTIANPQIANATFRLDTAPELFEAMQEAGYQPEIESLNLGFVFRNDPAFGPDSTSYLNTEKLAWLDGEVVVYCADHIDSRFASGATDSILALKKMGHYQFLEQYCHTSMAYTLSHIDAIIPPEEVRSLMQLEEGVPVLFMDDHVYNFDHEIVAHSMIYFRSGVLDLKFLRKNW
ncbi:GntR family transcriptional regulator [Pseudoflavonifractor sp. MSJ-37]|uniref:GntR family transcriptional regulator n=1 Tax=Pseudoflavonifractor sp. MSJ-37 TaxID=2841531 RepID=UPI001C0FDDC1|nr:GntR family transcriptional regulator [Pseudoflavonifractor sp. MSJ-37]